MAPNSGTIYEFDEFRLIPEENLLLRNGEAVSIKPKSFSTLVVLVERHGHLVEKSELIDKIWDNSFVEEAAVSRCVWSIRTALGEDSKEQRFIQTVPKRGYRFVAEVVEKYGANGHAVVELVRPENEDDGVALSTNNNALPIHRPSSGGISLAPHTIEKPERVLSFPVHEPSEPLHAVPPAHAARRISRYYAAVILIVLFACAVGADYFLSSPYRIVDPGSIIAVLPLKPVAAETRDSIIEFAIAESLILKMSAAPNLIVRPLGAVRKYVELDRDPIEAGRELNVDYVLSSNYQLIDGKIRVTSLLFNTQTAKAEATFIAESDTREKFAMQDAVANEIGNAVFNRFGYPGTIYAATRGTQSEDAYRLYLQGHYLVEKKSRQDAARAIEIFDAAIKLDPNYAQAWAGKANAHCTFAHTGGIEPSVAFELARPALKKANELDQDLSETAAVAGLISFDYDWDFDKGLEFFRKAIELNPKYEMPGRAYATRLALIGRNEDAIQQIKAAIDIYPNSVFHQWDYARILYASRKYDEAIAQFHRVLEMDPSFGWDRRLIWVSYHLKGDHSQAYEWFMQNLENSNAEPSKIDAYRKAYALSGWYGVLRRYSAVFQAQTKPGKYDPGADEVVLASSLIGDKNVAFKYIEASLGDRALWIPSLLHDPAFDTLRDDPRYAALVQRVEGR